MYLGTRMLRGKLTDEQVTFTGDEHILIIGPTRSGKSRRILVPNLIMDVKRSAIVVDPKAELFGWTAAHRAAAGHQIVTLDPFGEAGRPSSGFNPLTGLDPTSPEFVDDASALAEAIIQIPDKDPHWAESARDFVAGLIMYERCLNGEQASLKNVRHMITDTTNNLADIAMKAVTKVDNFGWPYAISNKLQRLVELTPDNKELLSVLSTAKTQTQFLDSGPISADLEKPGFDFSDMKRKLMTVYLILPPKRLRTHAKWLRLMIDAAIRDMQKQLRKPGEPEVLFMLDEFAQLGTMHSIETSMSLNAGYGVKVVAVIQHLGQLQHFYAENWETFLSGGLIATFAPRDVLTSEHLSRLSGQEWVSVTTDSVNQDGGGSSSVSQQLQATILPHDFRRMPRGKMIAFIPTPEGQVMRTIMARDATEMGDVIPVSVRVAMRS